ncbi:hypothetical protein [Leuconostoc citreum]|uniref:hypothetical protein n=1 Tax=Leuconostoc citreum TaxID=33964 RepID=UPI0032DF1F19
MNYQYYTKLYQHDYHKRIDALPKPSTAKKLVAELNRHFKPNQILIKNQVLLAQAFGISVASLMRVQTLVTHPYHQKYILIK